MPSLLEFRIAHAAAADKLNAAKANCDETCADESNHAPHRAELEAAYAAFSQASLDVVGAERAEAVAAAIARGEVPPPPSEPGATVTITREDTPPPSQSAPATPPAGG